MEDRANLSVLETLILIHPSVHPSIHPSICPSIPSASLFIHPLICLFSPIHPVLTHLIFQPFIAKAVLYRSLWFPHLCSCHLFVGLSIETRRHFCPPVVHLSSYRPTYLHSFNLPTLHCYARTYRA